MKVRGQLQALDKLISRAEASLVLERRCGGPPHHLDMGTKR